METRSQREVMIRVVLPAHLRTLARVEADVEVEVESPATVRAVLDVLEARYPALRGTMRDYVTMQRRPFLRFFACEEDLSHQPPDSPLPQAVVDGAEPLLIVGAMAGG
jgi:sulfur-carrier protein